MPYLLILLLYALILLIFILLAIFILYHLVRYSINPAMKLISLGVFGFIFVSLLLSNIGLFLSIEWSRILSALF